MSPSSPNSTADRTEAASVAAPVLRPDPARRIAPSKPKKRPRHGVYASAWALFGVAAGAYVFTLVLRQDGGPLLARIDTGEPAAMSKTQADVAQLQKTVGLLETDVARIKIDQAQADEREKHMAARVGTVENRVEQFSGQLTAQAATSAKGTKSAAVAEKPAAQTPPVARIATGALPTPQATVPTPPPQRELASVRQSPPTDAAQDPATAIVLARGPSIDALRLSWNLLNERYKTSLKSLEPRVVELEPGSYQLVAGPIANPAEALKVCATLKARGVACQAGDFKGNAL